MENSITKRLSLQNEILNWLKKFSEELESKANAVTLGINELVDQTCIVEQDMKNTQHAFRSLLYHQSTYNRISQEGGVSGETTEDTRRLGAAGIPAQSYENDILPRYKEAISLGLSSYWNHTQKRNRTSSTASSFNTGLVHDPLPHIIGSEEYVHDNSCGLKDTEDLILQTESINFSNITERQEEYTDGGPPGSDALLSRDLFGREQESSRKEGNEPLVSAALDFKAMLEAALLSPYKFYDKENSSSSTAVDSDITNSERIRGELDSAASIAADNTEVGTSEKATGTVEVPPTSSENAINFQASDIQSHYFSSALISGSLFDTDEEPISLPVQEIHEVFPTKDDLLSAGSGDSGRGKIEAAPNPSVVADDPDSLASKSEPLPDNRRSIASYSIPDEGNVVEASALHFRSNGLVSHVPNERTSVDFSEILNSGGVEGHCSSSNDLLMLCEDKPETRISFGHTAEVSLSLPSKEISSGSDCDGDEEDLSITSEDAVISRSHLASHDVSGDEERDQSSGHHSES